MVQIQIQTLENDVKNQERMTQDNADSNLKFDVSLFLYRLSGFVLEEY